MITIVPAILSDSLDVIQSQVDRIKNETDLTRVQVDIIDGEFVPEITVSPIDLLDIDFHGLDVDIHLMTNDPINDVIECAQVNGVYTIIGQIEHMGNQQEFIEHVQSYKLHAGLSLNRHTPVDSLQEDVLGTLEALQLMGIDAGGQGRPFGGDEILQKLDEIRGLGIAERMIDGGMNETTAPACIEHGANILVVGNFLWQAPSLSQAIAQLSKPL